VTGAPASIPSSGSCLETGIQGSLLEAGEPATLLLGGSSGGWGFQFEAPLSNPPKTGTFTAVAPDCTGPTPKCCSFGLYDKEMQQGWEQWGPGTGAVGCGTDVSATCKADACGSYTLTITSIQTLEAETWLVHGTVDVTMKGFNSPPLSASVTLSATF
jgi:hypothetical protein